MTRDQQPNRTRHFETSARACALMLVAFTAGCEEPADIQKSPFETSAVSLGGLSDAERARFHEGAGEFSEIESVAEGLGPFFNGSSCGHCHSGSGLGTSGVVRVMRVMCRTPNGELEAPPSGSLLHAFSTRPDMEVEADEGFALGSLRSCSR